MLLIPKSQLTLTLSLTKSRYIAKFTNKDGAGEVWYWLLPDILSIKNICRQKDSYIMAE